MSAVYARVRARRKPSVAGQPRYDRILSIDLSGPETALVTCRIGLDPRLYTDYLNFVRLDGRWRIVSKIYTWVPIRSEEHTSELQSLMRISYAVFFLKKKKT